MEELGPVMLLCLPGQQEALPEPGRFVPEASQSFILSSLLVPIPYQPAVDIALWLGGKFCFEF